MKRVSPLSGLAPGYEYGGGDDEYVGPVPRPLASKLGDWVSVLDFGPVDLAGDAPCTDVLRAALAAEARCVFFPAGTYAVDGPLEYTTYKGALVGPGATLRRLPSFADDDLLRVYLAASVLDLRFHGGSVDVEPGKALLRLVEDNCLARGLLMTETGTGAVGVEVAAPTTRLEGCGFHDFLGNTACVRVGAKGASVVGCYFRNCHGDGVHLASGARSTAIVGCTFDYVAEEGLGLVAGSAAAVCVNGARATTIAGCAFLHCGAEDAPAILARANAPRDLALVVSGCVLDSAFKDGVHVRSPADDVLVSGCGFRGTEEEGLDVRVDAGRERVVVASGLAKAVNPGRGVSFTLRPDGEVADFTGAGDDDVVPLRAVGPGTWLNHLALEGDELRPRVGGLYSVTASVRVFNADGQSSLELRLRRDTDFVGADVLLRQVARVADGACVCSLSGLVPLLPDQRLAAVVVCDGGSKTMTLDSSTWMSGFLVP